VPIKNNPLEKLPYISNGSTSLSQTFSLSQCRTAVLHCCKGDAASQWEMAILGVSELCNPWTDRVKIWHTWLRRWVDLVCRIT